MLDLSLVVMRGANFAHNDTIVTLLYQLVRMGWGDMVAENEEIYRNTKRRRIVTIKAVSETTNR